MKNRMIKIFLLTIMLLLCGMTEGSLKPAAADSKDDAVSRAKSYIKSSGFSRDGLVDQLEFEGFTKEEAEYGADNCGADWFEMAEKKAKSYIKTMGFSRDGLVDQLEYNQFTKEEAEYGADNCGADWFEMALMKAKSYTSFMGFSRDGLVDQLEFNKFTKEEAEYGADNCGADWFEMALIKAKSYIKSSGFSRDGLVDQLEFNGFTKEEAEYGADNCGADWNEMALKKAKSYMNTLNLTRTELIHQLEYAGFTDEQIAYALDALSLTETPEPVTEPNVVSDQMINVMTDNIDNIFVIRGLEDVFNTPMTAQYSDVGNATVVETSNQDGIRNISLYANADNVHDYSSVTKLNAGNLQNFFYYMEVQVNDVYPAGSGGCFIGYTNETTSAVQEEDVKTIGLLVDGDNAEFYVKGKDADLGEHIQLQRSDSDTYELVLVRFTGQTFAYVNGWYAGQYHDDLGGPFQLVYGSAVFSDGDNALCGFDNLIIRKVTN